MLVGSDPGRSFIEIGEPMLTQDPNNTNPQASYKPNADFGAQYIAFINPDSTVVDTRQVIGWGNSGEGWPHLTPITSTPDGPQALPFHPGLRYAYGPTSDDATRNLRWLNQGTSGVTIYDAVEVLYAHRHTLPNDALRSLQGIYLCASAARFGELYEPIDEEEFRATYLDHDVAGCEAEDGEVRDTGEPIFIGTEPDVAEAQEPAPFRMPARHLVDPEACW